MGTWVGYVSRTFIKELGFVLQLPAPSRSLGNTLLHLGC